VEEPTVTFEHEVAQVLLRYAAGRVTKDQALRWLLDHRHAPLFPTIDAIIQGQTLWRDLSVNHAGSEGKIAMMNRKIGLLDELKTTLLTML
jgi:hypothetical protein